MILKSIINNAAALFFELTKKDGIIVADSNLQDFASQSACMRASRQLDNQVPATDNGHHLSQKKSFHSQKNVPLHSTSKKLCNEWAEISSSVVKKQCYVDVIFL